jgi:hypothetical protein
LDGDADELSLDVLSQKRRSRPERVAVVFHVRLELVQPQKGRGVLLKLLVKEAKKLRRRPVDEESLLIASLDTQRVWFTPVHHSKKLVAKVDQILRVSKTFVSKICLTRARKATF